MNIKKSSKKIKLNNAGFTMIELIIVIAIMAIMVGGSVIGFNLLGQGDAKAASKNISSQLAELRTDTLSMDGIWTAEIYKSGNTYKLDIKKTINHVEELVSSTSIGSRIVITYYDLEKPPSTEIKDNIKIVVRFNQGDGKILSVKKFPSSNADGDSLIGSTSRSGDFIVTQRSSTTSNILTLWYLTGKVTSDY